jgi:predicted nucleic acid-binding protein
MSGNRYLLDTNAIITAIARENSAKLVTRDRQLDKITDLTIVDW